MIKNALVFLLAMVTTACTQSFQNINSTLEEAIWGFEDVNLSEEEIKKLPYASAYVRINDGQQIFMVLGYADQSAFEQPVLKWISADNAMIATVNGRVVKTLNLPEANLASVNFEANALPNFMPSAWQATYDWQEQYRYGFLASGVMDTVGTETITTPIWHQHATIWREHVKFNGISSAINNTFWVNNSGQVIKSIQHIGPDMTKVEMQFLKFFSE
ncbi:YjbF family lipoprotein [Vibrio alfacsensis]|uniref:YjbF family lipoprotein n=1 Tax=Vibrio alfacsensis TaxID=1074311 RepID=UPI004068C9E4